ncbi:unnamed protein product [Adineta steineri]|uniref:NHL repeat containing protein n=2 Tax=Adineta steineri TaxID=433720 RepID=A0A819XS80_9BILA|nr:unnamed protein product [Adineta steineri]
MYCYIIFVILSVTVKVKSQICEKIPQYGQCSTNIACGCFHMVGADENTGVCGFLWPTCSRLQPCISSDNSCLQPNTICVQHPYCDDRPLCYPTTLIQENYCPPMTNKTSLKWKQSAITVAGGHGHGSELNQLSSPSGIFIDDENTIYIADAHNHRIVTWKPDSKNGQVIAGGNGMGNAHDQLYWPSDVVFDKQNNSLIICDRGNGRVVQWLYQDRIKQQILISNIACEGVAIDKNEFLYVSDSWTNAVRRWKMGAYNEGVVVAGGNEKGSELNQFAEPNFIFVDEDQSVYVSDQDNHRVMKWKKDAKEGIVIAGGNGPGANLNQLIAPQGVIVDHLGQVYVADIGNHRVMRWCEGDEKGEIVVGGNGIGVESNQLFGPASLSFDDKGNLYVVERSSGRVQKFLVDI